MSEAEERDLLSRVLDDGRIELRAPAVGLWTGAPLRDAALAPGDAAGTLLVLGRAILLRVPAGTGGRVVSDPPELRRAPVGYGDRLLVLEPAVASHSAPPSTKAVTQAARVLSAAQSGRFWQRPEPGAPAFVAEGSELEEGRTFGLLEVMKTFQPMKYRAASGHPAPTRLLRWLVADGAEVAEGQSLAELG